LGSTAGALLQANGRLKVAMSLQLLRVAALAALLYAFTPRFGFTGTAAAVAGAGLVTSAIQVSIAARSVEARWLDLVAALKHAAVACLPLLALRLAILPLDASWLLPAALLSGTASLYFVARGLKEHSGLGFPGFFSGDRVASGRP
jgi:O-antigen/teichoic acid export membrane protein